MKYKLITLLGLCGSALVSFMGGWDMALQTLVIFMVIDWITGGIWKKSEIRKWCIREPCRLEGIVQEMHDVVICVDRGETGCIDGKGISEGCGMYRIYRE